jgi:thioredoxin-related protein
MNREAHYALGPTMKTLLAICCLLVAPLTALAADSSAWSTDYQAALEKAKTENKKVFLFFTGSDWCGWCKRLNREILATPDFKKYADEKLVLVELDFPRGKSQSAEVKAQNTKLMQQYKIEGYPTVIVLNSDGKKLGDLGYQEGGPSPFVEALEKM